MRTIEDDVVTVIRIIPVVKQLVPVTAGIVPPFSGVRGVKERGPQDVRVTGTNASQKHRGKNDAAEIGAVSRHGAF